MLQHRGLNQHAQRAWYQDQWKLVMQQDVFFELYDLHHDTHERRNPAMQTGYTDVITRFQRGLQDRMRELDDPFLQAAVR